MFLYDFLGTCRLCDFHFLLTVNDPRNPKTKKMFLTHTLVSGRNANKYFFTQPGFEQKNKLTQKKTRKFPN